MRDLRPGKALIEWLVLSFLVVPGCLSEVGVCVFPGGVSTDYEASVCSHEGAEANDSFKS